MFYYDSFRKTNLIIALNHKQLFHVTMLCKCSGDKTKPAVYTVQCQSCQTCIIYKKFNHNIKCKRLFPFKETHFLYSSIYLQSFPQFWAILIKSQIHLPVFEKLIESHQINQNVVFSTQCFIAWDLRKVIGPISPIFSVQMKAKWRKSGHELENDFIFKYRCTLRSSLTLFTCVSLSFNIPASTSTKLSG